MWVVMVFGLQNAKFLTE